MNDIQPPLLEVEIHPAVTARMDALELTQTRQEADILHWKGVAQDAAAVAVDAKKATEGHVARGGAWVRDLMGVGGLVSLGVGCWWLHPAAALIVVGSVALGLVVFGTLARHKMERERVRSDS